MGAAGSPACCQVLKKQQEIQGSDQTSELLGDNLADDGENGLQRIRTGGLRSPTRSPTKDKSFALSFDPDFEERRLAGTKARVSFEGSYVANWAAPKLGQGTFGLVQRVVHKDTQDDFAVKYMRRRQGISYHIEIKIQKAMDHPNIVKVKDSFYDTKEVFIILELCTGGDLFDAVLDEAPFSESVSANSLSQMLQAVSYLHSRNIIHRDLKAENWLLQEPGRLKRSVLKLCDFGTAKALDPEDSAETKIGSPYYVAPEIAWGHKYNTKVDIWSIGVILHMLLCDEPPFRGNTKQVLSSVKEQHIAFTDLERTFSAEAFDMLVSLLQKDPSERVNAEEALEKQVTWQAAIDRKQNKPEPEGRRKSSPPRFSQGGDAGQGAREGSKTPTGRHGSKSSIYREGSKFLAQRDSSNSPVLRERSKSPVSPVPSESSKPSEQGEASRRSASKRKSSKQSDGGKAHGDIRDLALDSGSPKGRIDDSRSPVRQGPQGPGNASTLGAASTNFASERASNADSSVGGTWNRKSSKMRADESPGPRIPDSSSQTDHRVGRTESRKSSKQHADESQSPFRRNSSVSPRGSRTSRGEGRPTTGTRTSFKDRSDRQ